MKKSLFLLALLSSIQISAILAMAEAAVLNQTELNQQLFENIDQPEVVLTLIHMGANVNAKKDSPFTYDGSRMMLFRLTPLILASQKGLLETCKHLTDNGAETNAQSSLADPPVYADPRVIEGLTPLFWAEYSGHVEVYDFLLNTSKLNALDDMNGMIRSD